MTRTVRRLGTRLEAVSSSRPFTRLLDVLERCEPPWRDRFHVLTYHRVGDPGLSSFAPGTLSATASEFAAQMEYLRARFNPISGRQLVAACRGEIPLPERCVVVTFDDAYVDVADVAWPILKRLDIPAVVFVPTAYPDTQLSFWWDRLHAIVQRAEAPLIRWRGSELPISDVRGRVDAYRRIRDEVKRLPHDVAMAALEEMAYAVDVPDIPNSVLGWASLRRLASEGMQLAPHSRTHPLLTRVTNDRVREEVKGSIDELSAAVGENLPLFAYPNGSYDQRVKDTARSHGVEVGFTTERGVNRMGSIDWLAVRRLNVGRRTSVPVLRAQLLSLSGRIVQRVA